MKHFYKALALLVFPLSVFLLSGCAQGFSNFTIEDVAVPSSNPCPVKFYAASISGGFVKPDIAEEIKRQLVIKYPDFFSNNEKDSIRLNFYWNIDYNQGGLGVAFLSGLTFGIIPCISHNDHTGTLAARFPRMGSFLSKNNQNNKYGTLSYTVKQGKILHMVSLAIITDPIAGMFMSAGSDLSSPYFASIQEELQTPFQNCDANLRLFPLACVKLYQSLSEEERKILLDKYKPKEIQLLR